MKAFLLFFIFLNTFYGLCSVLPEQLKTHVDTTPVTVRKNLFDLTKFLVKPCSNESEKVQVFSYWIAKNIKYDLKEHNSIDRNKIAHEVFNDRSAVCAGFARLLKRMCELENIKCYFVEGYAEGTFFQRHFAKEKCAHAWNAVYVDKNWKLVDVTWMVDIVKTSTFKKTRDLVWVYPAPFDFAKTHNPDDPRWQMLKDPRTREEFWKRKELTKRHYNYSDSLDILHDKTWFQVKMLTYKGAYLELQDPEHYMKRMIRLGWDLVGGNYDSLETSEAVKIFKLCLEEYQTLSPYKNHKKHEKMIRGGLWLCQRRSEMKE